MSDRLSTYFLLKLEEAKTRRDRALNLAETNEDKRAILAVAEKGFEQLRQDFEEAIKEEERSRIDSMPRYETLADSG